MKTVSFLFLNAIEEEKSKSNQIRTLQWECCRWWWHYFIVLIKIGHNTGQQHWNEFYFVFVINTEKIEKLFCFFVISCDALLLFLVIVFDSGARKHTQIAVFFLFCFVRNYFWITDRVSVSLISLCQFFSGIKSLTQREPINCQHVPIHSLTNSFQNNFQQQIIHLEADPLLSLSFFASSNNFSTVVSFAYMEFFSFNSHHFVSCQRNSRASRRLFFCVPASSSYANTHRFSRYSPCTFNLSSLFVSLCFDFPF